MGIDPLDVAYQPELAAAFLYHVNLHGIQLYIIIWLGLYVKAGDKKPWPTRPNQNFKRINCLRSKRRVKNETIMTEQLLLTLMAATIGFVAAIFFCIGNALNSAEKILLQSSTYWDFNKHLASSLAAQRSQYAVGALLLLVSFLLQVAAALAPAANYVALPLYLHTWPAIVFAVLVLSLLIAGGISGIVYKTTIRKVLRKEEELRFAHEAKRKKNQP